MASIRKRKWTNIDGSSTTKWIIDYKDQLGNRKQGGSFKTKAEAEIELTKIKSKLIEGTFINQDKTMCFSTAANSYLEVHAEVHCKKSTMIFYEQIIKNHLSPYFGNMKIININKPIIDKFVSIKKKSGLSEKSINHYLTLLSCIFEKLVNDGVLFVNPVKKVKRFKLTRKEMRFLEPKEIHACLDTAKTYYTDFYPLLFTAIFTGMRKGELIALTWDKINWQTKKIKVDTAIYKGQLGTPKSNNYRHVDMSNELIKVLKEWKLKAPISAKNLVFPNSAGNHLDPDNFIDRKFMPIIRKAGISKINFHGLRHSYVALLIAQNIPIKYIQNQVGHSSIEVTLDTYGHLMPEVHQKGVQALDSLFIYRECQASEKTQSFF